MAPAPAPHRGRACRLLSYDAIVVLRSAVVRIPAGRGLHVLRSASCWPRSVPRPSTPGSLRHLDFGSGVGVTVSSFNSSATKVTLADLSTTLLDFARFRFERRGEKATFIDLNETSLAPVLTT